MKHIRKAYNVPAKRGMRVYINGKNGVITGSINARIRVRFDGQRFSITCHPTWEVEYLV